MRSVARPPDFEKASKRVWSCARSLLTRRLALAFALFLCLIAAGCAHPAHTARPPIATPPAQPSPSSGPPPPIERQPVVPGEYVEQGVASWYGNPFDGRRTSSGDIYDMHAFTAAHRTLPFGAVVRVTNLRNGRQTEVRINDRGPFVADRIIDLSFSAAQAIGMIGTGTAQVRIEVIAGPDPRVGFFGVQVGAFRMQDNAERLRAQLAADYAPISIATYDSPSGLFYRVRAGRLPTEDAAGRLAEELRARKHLITFVVRLDE